MKHTVPRSMDTLTAISCDRCGQAWSADTLSAAEFTSIGFVGGYDSVFGDGSQVELDLCHRCLKQALGQWLRVSDRNHDESALARGLKAFDPARHGGEMLADAPVGLERLEADARASNDRNSQAIDAALDAAEQGEMRIEKIESVERLKGMFGIPREVPSIEQMQMAIEHSAADARGAEDTLTASIIGLVEFDLRASHFIGKIIGFPHIEFIGPTVLDVRSKLVRGVNSMTENNVLVLESKFVGVVFLGSFPNAKDQEGRP